MRVWTYVGLIVALGAFAYLIFIIAQTLIYGVDVPGYASLLVTILFLGGVQLIGIGMLGEYIGRIYTEAKQRPVYLVRAKFKNGAEFGGKRRPLYVLQGRRSGQAGR